MTESLRFMSPRLRLSSPRSIGHHARGSKHTLSEGDLMAELLVREEESHCEEDGSVCSSRMERSIKVSRCATDYTYIYISLYIYIHVYIYIYIYIYMSRLIKWVIYKHV